LSRPQTGYSLKYLKMQVIFILILLDTCVLNIINQLGKILSEKLFRMLTCAP